MADVLILDIPRTVAIPDADASGELQSVASGSGQFPLAGLNYPLASGVLNIDDAAQTSWTVSYGATLRSNPTRFRLTLMLAADGDTMPGLAAVLGTTTSFVINLSGPAGVVTSQVFWEALA